MAKISTIPIDQSALEAYLDTDSDFGFEIQVLKLLRELGADCTHGSTYEDPKTKKYREFDIRAHLHSERSNVRLAVECKNIKNYSPLLVSCLPRTRDQAYHEVICSFDPKNANSNPYPKSDDFSVASDTIWQGSSITINVNESESIYKTRDPVGKSCVQVTRAAHDNSFSSSDGDVYDKWSQAVSSCYDVAQHSDTAGKGLLSGFEYSAVIPVLVVPDDCLWRVCYNTDGSVSSGVEKVDRVSYFLGTEMNSSSIPGFSIKLSHIEFVTIDGLSKLVEDFTKNDCLSLMPKWYMDEEIKRKTST